ncbi:MAG: hypothetical protein Q9170_000029 [Blastenia crenularia]
MKRSMTGIENDFQRLSILSRLNNPFAAKRPRNVSEYSIELDEPYKTFAPGDRIRGHIVLNVERPVRISHLTICLHGVVKVLKNGRISGESTNRWRSYLATGQGKWGEAYFGNGLAALFKDEVVLAGDGCLSASSYIFNFDLELPAERLPSSIDVSLFRVGRRDCSLFLKQFQHGCISYLLSSTLTRPTTLRPANFLPTSRCERIVTVKENIDIACLPDAISQVIPLDTIHRKPRRTKTTVISQVSETPKPCRSQRLQTFAFASAAVSETSDESVQNPSTSDITCASTASSGRNEHESGSVLAVRRGSAQVDGQSTTSSDEAAISPHATVDMLQSGCLPGDVISVKVTINLGRHFKNPQGIILTLYRECHIDIHPAIPLGSWQNGNKQEYEDYYPKSHTGLGGLSLSSGGSSRVFRQDISQKSTALYVDKQTLNAAVKASLHVPEGVFPTISTVPGRMIDFKYYVETIIDLRGRSTIQEHILPRLSMVNAVPNFGPGEPTLDSQMSKDDMKFSLNAGLPVFDTSQIRREKGVVTHISEVVVGTRDSRRSRVKKTDHSHARDELQTESLQRQTNAPNKSTDHEQRDPEHLPRSGAEDSNHNLVNHAEQFHAVDFAPAHDVPAPEIEDHVDEKTRLRRAEEFLLPSAPPEDGEAFSSIESLYQPSAPVAFDDNDFWQGINEAGPSAPAYGRSSAASHFDTIASSSQPSCINGYDEALSNDRLEDKQELEYRRLQAQASSPDQEAMGGPLAEASAPLLDEDEVARYTRQQHQGEHLPQYQA